MNKRTRKNKKTKTIKNRSKKTRTRKNRIKKTRKVRSKKSIGGMRTYTLNGRFTTDPEILHEGKDFFRKMTHNKGEIELCALLMKNPHKNIIQIYGIGNDYVDMELLNTDIHRADMSEIKKVMVDVKTHLQNLGIMYIDWKLDNIGVSEDGQYKLFDFDVSGLTDIETKEWIIEPPKYWSYNKATQNGMISPTDIDNYAFDIGLTKI